MPHQKKAELIEGVVYAGSPVSSKDHGVPHSKLSTWLGYYAAMTAGIECADNSTVRLDWDNEPQPDLFLRIIPGRGGQSRDEGRYVAGSPELCCEIAASSAAYDLHDKKEAFRRSGVREYLVWRTLERVIDWFVLRGGAYERQTPTEGVVRSEVFPGLWLDVDALLNDDVRRVLELLGEGLESDEHRAFRQALVEAGSKTE